MAEERAQRRLAAVLAAGVVGFSRLMELDEIDACSPEGATQGRLGTTGRSPGGRVFKATGDGVPVRFGGAVNAVECAIALQTIRRPSRLEPQP